MIAILDTNVILYQLGGNLAEPLPLATYAMSVITEMEVLSYPSMSADEESRVREHLNEITRIDLTSAVRETAVRLRKAFRLKLPDAIIAATAQVFDAELFTNDDRLAGLAGLRVRRIAMK